MFIDNLIELKEDLSQRHRDKETLKMFYFESRLQDSLNSYTKELENSLAYLEHQNEIKLFRKLEKLKNGNK